MHMSVCFISDRDLVQIKNTEEVSTVQYSLMEAFSLHLSRTYSRHLWVFSQAMVIYDTLKQSRSTINRDRITSHRECFKFGVPITPLMQSVVYNRPVNLVESILNEDEEVKDVPETPDIMKLWYTLISNWLVSRFWCFPVKVWANTILRELTWISRSGLIWGHSVTSQLTHKPTHDVRLLWAFC